MKKIINSNPAPYPETSTAEYDSVVTLLGLLDKRHIKHDLKILDKFPNTDTIFEVVSEDQIPIGKIDVQIKILDKRHKNKPKYQCKTDFLSFCELSILPVLIIVVDVYSNKAYWCHINRNLLEDLAKKIKKKSVNLNIPHTNVISKTDNGYVKEWQNIINSQLHRLIDYDSVKLELASKLEEYKKLQSIVNPAYNVEKDLYKEIHVFLDYYNNLLENDFFVIKNVFYNDVWKIGLAYSKYTDKSISYSLFPIQYSHNDIQIKEMNAEQALRQKSLITFVSHYTENPIKIKPLIYAYKYIIKDLKKILDNYTIRPVNQYLANENLISFIDQYSYTLGVEKGKKNYPVKNIKRRFHLFLPLFIERFMDIPPQVPKTQVIPFNLSRFDDYFTLDKLRIISTETEERYINDQNSNYKYSFNTKEFNSNYLWNLILYLDQLNIKHIERIYEIRKPPSNQLYFTWQVYNKQQVIAMLNKIYSELPKIYDAFILEYFPKIYEEINFFNGFNTVIISVKMIDNKIEYSEGPIQNTFYLKSINNQNDNRVDVYLNEDCPITWENLSQIYMNKNIIEIDDIEYKVISANNTRLRNVFLKHPMQEYIFDTLRKRLSNYLKLKTDESFSISDFDKD